jgi:hypothetical protein
MVLKLEHVQPALSPPAIDTGSGKPASKGEITLNGKLTDLGKAAEVSVGFEYQEYLGFTEALYNDAWIRTPLKKQSSPGGFQTTVKGLQSGKTYRFRAIAVHPGITMKGEFQQVQAP